MAIAESHNPEKSNSLGSRIRIQPPNGLSLLSIRELWRYRELLLFLTWRDIQVRYKQTVIGVAWAVLQPLMLMFVFTMFLGRNVANETSDVPYALFVFCGLLPWTFFASAISHAGNSVVNSEKLVTKVYFPRILIPLASIGSALVDLFFASLLLLGMLAWNQVPLTWNMLLAPVLMLAITMTAIGIGTLLAALHVAYRDVKYVLPFLIQLWLFATPSVYSSYYAKGESGSTLASLIPILCKLNPMVGLVESFRNAILGLPMDPMQILQSLMVAVLFLILGCLYFRWVEHRFADII